MKTRAYAWFGAVVLTALTVAHFTGWAFVVAEEGKSVPRSVRDNPGSARSIYGPRSTTGAK